MGKFTGSESKYRGHMTTYIKVNDPPLLPQCKCNILQVEWKETFFLGGGGGGVF